MPNGNLIKENLIYSKLWFFQLLLDSVDKDSLNIKNDFDLLARKIKNPGSVNNTISKYYNELRILSQLIDIPYFNLIIIKSKI